MSRWVCLGIIVSVASLVFGVPTVSADGFTMLTVVVGNEGNPGELSGLGAYGHGPDRICGGVDYVYEIAMFEVTAGQYCEFLNAVAADDTHDLYNGLMSSYYMGCKIRRTGTTPNRSYEVDADWADRPVNYVSWMDAARFCNWLHNGRPTGSQDLTTTEDGVYRLSSAASLTPLVDIVRKEGWTWAIPTEDEWYKAAYHKNDGVTGNYWTFPVQEDDWISNDVVDPDPGFCMNYRYDYFSIGSPYYRTIGGEFENSYSSYGTFDQGGNVSELLETKVYSSDRVLRGGYFGGGDQPLRAEFRYNVSPGAESYAYGFRVVRAHQVPTCELPGDVDRDGQVNGDDIAGFIRAKMGNPGLHDNPLCADYGTGTLDGDAAAFIADLLGM